jgi:hypothetical protein
LHGFFPFSAMALGDFSEGGGREDVK